MSCVTNGKTFPMHRVMNIVPCILFGTVRDSLVILWGRCSTNAATFYAVLRKTSIEKQLDLSKKHRSKVKSCANLLYHRKTFCYPDAHLNSASTSSKWSKKPLNNCTPNPGSLLPIVARMLCILNCGSPASIALMPIALDSIGPTVPPDRESFLIWNTCSFASHFSATRCKNAVLMLSVVVCPFGSAWMAMPVLSLGAWFSR